MSVSRAVAHFLHHGLTDGHGTAHLSQLIGEGYAIPLRRPNGQRSIDAELRLDNCAFAQAESTHDFGGNSQSKGVSGFLCVRRLGELAFGQFFFCLQAPAKPPEVLWLGRAHMVQLLIGWLAPAA
jgi:hypothetical protein